MNHSVSSAPIVKQTNADFVVREVSLYPENLGATAFADAHTLVELSKEGYTTFEAMQELAIFFHVSREAVHCEGLKDEDGITTQLISVHYAASEAEMEAFSTEYAAMKKGWIRGKIVGYAAEPVAEKKLHANVFSVTLRRLSEDQAAKLNAYCEANADFICANYYDQQRFGLPGGPYQAHHIGKAIMDKDWALANQLYETSGNLALDSGNNRDARTFDIRTVDTRKLQFFISAYSSALWDKKLSAALTDTTQIEIFEGFAVNMLSDFTQPVSLQIEDTGYVIDPSLNVREKPKKRTATIATTIYCSSPVLDDLNRDLYKLVLDFALPTGSYATMVIKQLVKHCDIKAVQVGPS